MNELNVKLQGEDQFVNEMFTNISKFKAKPAPFSKQMSSKSFTHVPTLTTLKETHQHMKKYRESLDDLNGEFCCWFSDLGKINKSLQLIPFPFTKESETAPQEMQLELTPLQCDCVLMEKLNSPY
uniref:GTD2B n=1 Tax=Poeciliopsis prolifica TaxID=188132 RepID=A0A0S7ETE8_9TELE